MTAFLGGVALLVAAGIVAATRPIRTRRPAAWLWLFVIGCAIAAVPAVRVLASKERIGVAIHATTPGGDWALGIDSLTAVFLLAILGVGAACAVFGARYMADSDAQGAPPWFAHLSFSILVASIALVVTARSIVVFLGAWEVMAISSYTLIVTDHHRAEARRAGLIYLVATHTATLALFAMFAVWANASSDWSFDALALAAPSLGTGATAAVLVLALIGFGFKAGAVPLHIWLPPAHAAAPSHVSALMSGIVIKTGIYGLLRVVLLLGGAPAWWGWAVLVLGAASGVLGVLWALAQHDIKRLLAYHSVENIGIILMGTGVGVLGGAYSMPALAVLGFGGALLHTVNHALFKSALFLGAGTVYWATGTRTIDALGGLAHRMPFTWLWFVVGAAAIVGLPPLNGFVSEWLVYQGMFAAMDAHGPLRVVVSGIPVLALIGALALACFTKVAGIAFLGTPRSAAAASAREADAAVLVPLGALGAACVILGVLPIGGIWLVSDAAADLAAPSGATNTALATLVAPGAWRVSLVASVVVGMAAALWWLRYTMLRTRVVRREVTWRCGYAEATPRTQYTGSSFAAPLLSVFGRASGVRVRGAGVARTTHAVDLVLDGIALPLWHALQRIALRLRPLQQGRLHIYLLYVMAALLALLAYLRLAPGP